MAFQQGLSGLNAALQALNVTSNNVSNSATVGFKSGQALFADVFANSLTGSGAAQVGIGTSVGAIQQQFTQGNITTTNNPLDLSINGGGFYRMDTNGTISYSRAGQFHLDKNGYVIDDQSRRLTGYLADATGTIVKAAPQDLLLSSANQDPIATGASGTALAGVQASLNFDSRTIAPSIAFSKDIPASYNFSTATSIYDSLGNAHTLTLYTVKVVPPGVVAAIAADTAAAAAVNTAQTNYNTALAAYTPLATANPLTAIALTAAQAGFDALPQTVTPAQLAAAIAAANVAVPGMGTAFATMTATKTALVTANANKVVTAAAVVTQNLIPQPTTDWTMYASVDGTSTVFPGLTNNTLTFDQSGKLTGGTGLVGASINLTNVMANQTTPQINSAVTPLAFNIDFSQSTQFGSAFGTNSLQQDGYMSGRLTGVSVGGDGVIRGNYSNGQSRNLGQVALASFTNPNALTSQGGNQWAESAASGSALVGAPNTGALGVLQSAAVEDSNVDLTAELVNMITEQRNYQANAQSIKTEDQIMQTLVSLR